MYSDVTGIILAGGKSSRMGTSKSLLNLGDKTLIETTAGLLQSLFSKIYIITNSPSEYSFLHLPAFEDVYKEKGPLAGIHSGLLHSGTETNFIISCDMPLMTKEMIAYIVDNSLGNTATYCHAAGYHQPLAGVYLKSLIAEIEPVICSNEASDKSFHRFLHTINAKILHPQNMPFYHDEIFFNVNSPKDFSYILHRVTNKDMLPK
ncbi:MAG: molybdenum cofactor guanylyltransferase [Ignavibacteriales bacterium]|nr:molybdenum cofactor guanylyltransferase [Ignavibacteriales bacterium]